MSDCVDPVLVQQPPKMEFVDRTMSPAEAVSTKEGPDRFLDLTKCEKCEQKRRRTVVFACGHQVCKMCCACILETELVACPLCPDVIQRKWKLVDNYFGNMYLLSLPCEVCCVPGAIVAICETCGHVCKTCFNEHVNNLKEHQISRREVTALKGGRILCKVHDESLEFLCTICEELVCDLCCWEEGAHFGHTKVNLTSELNQQRLAELRQTIEAACSRIYQGNLVAELAKSNQSSLKRMMLEKAKIQEREREMIQAIKDHVANLCEQLETFHREQTGVLEARIKSIQDRHRELCRQFTLLEYCACNAASEFQQLHIISNLSQRISDPIERQIACALSPALERQTMVFEIGSNCNAAIMNSFGWVQEMKLTDTRSGTDQVQASIFGAVGDQRAHLREHKSASSPSVFPLHYWNVDDQENRPIIDVFSTSSRSGHLSQSPDNSGGILAAIGAQFVSTTTSSLTGSDESPLSPARGPPSPSRLQRVPLSASNLTNMTYEFTNLELTNSVINMKFFKPEPSPNYLVAREQMRYFHKFGEFGENGGQFSEPSGIAVLLDGQIVVADTNGHRIQVFRNGQYQFQFGEEGRRDGQFMYPNRVAVCRRSGNIVITERSPTHQVQIYTPTGHFIQKFGNQILQHPRGVCVDKDGRIIVVECKVMRVVIFDPRGRIINQFKCERLQFPNSITVDEDYRIYICDNKAHSVLVFNYKGDLLGTIGNPGLTNYPIGVAVYQGDKILVADNHNNFNVTIFTPEGKRLRALESMVKHAQCLDIAMLEDGSMALACKDYRVYIYQFIAMNA